MRHLFVMDPLDRIHVSGDSTYVVMCAACERGDAVAWCTPDRLFVQDGEARATVTYGAVARSAPPFRPDETIEVALGSFDVVWMRKDPPFDMTYILSTYLLDLIPATTLVVNNPLGLKRFNEKIWAMHFARFQPPTLLSRDLERLRAFVEAQPEGAVLKPWDGNGGRGIVMTRKGDRNLPSLLELMTANGVDYAIAQAFIPGVSKGDKRILLFDGEPVGAVLRVPGESDHRANLHVGGKAVACELDEDDLQICAALGPELKAHGQIFVGIDVIAGKLTEINVTSPTGLQEYARLTGVHLEHRLVETVAKLAAAKRAQA